MAKKKLLVTSEPFGYGPTGKLLSIIKHLGSSEFECVFVGEGSAMTLVLDNQQYFSEIMDSIKSQDELLKGCDAVLSVMEPSVIVSGFSYKKPVFYVDSLPFLWQPTLSEIDLASMKKNLLSNPHYANRLIHELDIHNIQAFAHYLANECFIQRYNGFEHKLTIPSEIKVGAIVPFEAGGNDFEVCDILVTLSGQVSFLSSPQSSLYYANYVLEMCHSLQKRIGEKYNISVVVSPGVSELIPDEIRRQFNVCNLSHNEMIFKIKNCRLLVCPPGLTTVFESISLRTPYILLPDQHFGHRINRDILDPEQIFTLGEIYSDMSSSDPIEITKYMQAEIMQLMISSKYSEFTDSAARKITDYFFNNDLRNSLLIKQNEIFTRVVGDSTGAREVADGIRKVMGNGAVF